MSKRLTIHSKRLDLVACDLRLIELALENRRELARELDAVVPRTWPPAVMVDVLDMHLARLESDPQLADGWLSWLMIVRDTPEGRVLVGTVGFSGRPDSTGTLRIGFSIIPEYEGRGLVTEAARALIEWAFQQPRVERITAEAYIQHDAYIHVLERLGMVPGEMGTHPGCVQYILEKQNAVAQPTA
jgi:RimJ/RimL family protein N-acetyltransferase